MIASDRVAIRVGTAKLVVDGTDETLTRQAKIALSPNRIQGRSLEGLVEWSRELYNGALQHRRDAWRIARVSISRYDQFLELGALRGDHPQVARYGNQPMRGALSRLDEAFAGFFRRQRDGRKAGYPRFRSAGRFRSVFYDEPVNWALRGLANCGGGQFERPVLYVQGVGELALSTRAARQLRRLFDRGGEVRTLTITKTCSGSWRATVGFRGVHVSHLNQNAEVGGVDRGITVTAALPNGTLLRCPRFLDEARLQISTLQRERAQHPKFSRDWKRCNRSIAKAYRAAHRRSENWARHAAKEIVATYGVISLEDLALRNMVRSARGSEGHPGKGVAAKKGLNRSIQEAALGRLAYWICVKAEEAGRRVWKVDPRNSSRECAACGHTEPANRHREHFACRRCGHREHADVNAAQVLSSRGQAADVRWRTEGSPLLKRPVPKNLRNRRKEQYGAGSAPHVAEVA